MNDKDSISKHQYTCLKSVGPELRGCGQVFDSWDALKAHEAEYHACDALKGSAVEMPNPFRRRLAMLETTGPTNLPRLEISFQTLSDMQAASDWLRALGREAPRTSEELAP